MLNEFAEKDWDTLLTRIDDGKCTPFLGAGACHGVLPLGCEIAQKWAKDNGYPLENCSDLAQVAQFLAVYRGDHMFPKDEIARVFKNVVPPEFNEPDEPHSVLASLPLPVYMTTNYDDFMVQALKSQGKDPKLEFCRWNEYVKGHPSIFDSEPGFDPTPANPVVYHLHGYKGVTESMVLTEDDYLDFLVSISSDPALLPPRIKRALTGSSLLFIGYRMADWSFRVLFRGLVAPLPRSLRRLSVSVQLPEVPDKKVQEYLTEYFKNEEVQVYWGTAREFAVEMNERWKRFKNRIQKNDN